MRGIVLLFLVTCVHGTTLLESLKIILQTSDAQLLSIRKPEPLDTHYDFIVVGAGTAGCTVASRLSETPEWQVLLLETGGPEPFYADIPVLVGDLQNTDVDWQYKTEPHPNYCLGGRKGQCSLPRGRIFGGSSVLNYMLATRGNRRDYDKWASLGNAGWSYEDVLPFFRQAENMTINDYRNDSSHGYNGPLSISHSTYRTKLAEAFMEAGNELGHLTGNYNGLVQNQFSYFQFTKNNGRRISNSRAYIYPVYRDRKNLHIRMNAFVTRVIFKDLEAVGVEVEYDGGTHQIYSRKEVILSGGSYNSPQILMLSGIGPKKHLEKFQIPVLYDSPVGHNYQDHVSFAGLFFLTNITDRDLNSSCISNDPQNMVSYIMRGQGPYEIPGGNEGVFFYDFNKTNDKDGYPEIEMHFSSSVSPKPEERLRGFSEEVYRKVFNPYQGMIGWAVQPILMHPKSRGVVELRSNDPHDKVKIVPNFLQHPDDVQYILKGVKKAMEISKTRAFQRYGSKLNPSVMPGCEAHRHASDEYWKCAMRVMTISNYHPTSTCAMGPQGVVDERLRVRGVTGLRVVDASVMPEVPAAHTNIPTNMVAEKGAAMIIADNKQNK